MISHLHNSNGRQDKDRNYDGLKVPSLIERFQTNPSVKCEVCNLIYIAQMEGQIQTKKYFGLNQIVVPYCQIPSKPALFQAHARTVRSM